MSEQPLARKSLPSQVFTELYDLSQPQQLKKLNDDLRLLYRLLGYGVTSTGDWFSGGTSGEGVQINGDDVTLTVENLFLAALDAQKDSHLVIAESGSGMPSLNVVEAMRIQGRRLVLPPGEWYMYVGTDATGGNYGEPVQSGASLTGDQKYSSLYCAVMDIPKVLLGNLNIVVDSQAADAVYEPIRVEGVVGDGTVTISGVDPAYRIKAAGALISETWCDVAIRNVDFYGSASANIWWQDRYGANSAWAQPATVTVKNARAFFNTCRIRGMATGAVAALAGATVDFTACVTRYGTVSYYAERNSRISLSSCTGSDHTYAAQAVTGGVVSGTGSRPSGTWNTPISLPTLVAPEVGATGQIPEPSSQSGLPSPDAAYVWATGYAQQAAQAAGSMAVTGAQSASAAFASLVLSLNSWGTNIVNAIRSALSEGLVIGDPTQSTTNNNLVQTSTALTVTAMACTDSGTYAEGWLIVEQEGGAIVQVTDAQQGLATNEQQAMGVLLFSVPTIPTNVQSVRMTITRAPHRGLPGPVPIQISGYDAPNKTQPPQKIKDYGFVGNLSWGETRSVYLPVEVADDFRDGIINAIGVFSGESNAAAILGLPPYLPRIEFWSW